MSARESLEEKAEREMAAYEPVRLHDSEGKPRKQGDVLIDIGSQHVLFHDPGGDAYAQIQINGHAEVHPIESAVYRELLSESYLDLAGKGCNRNALTDATTTLSAVAKFRGEEHTVWLRTGWDGDDIVIDSGGRDWSVIRITPAGWTVEPGGAVKFRRAGKPLPLPKPADKGDIGLLWRYLNVNDDDRVLIAAFLLGALRPDSPYAPLLLSGEQGSGKSTFSKVIKALVDPSASPLRAPPKEVRDLLVAALNSWVLALDNLSYLPMMLSDAFCRMSTGGSISERTLYSNLDETLVEVKRPAILNGIEELATRPDLAQRGIHIELQPIQSRRTESAFWQSFRQDAPKILAAILDGLVMALRDADSVQINLSRMADFAVWAEAGLPALGFERGQFSAAYEQNQSIGMSLGLESSPAGRAIQLFMAEREEWIGTATDLLHALAGHAEDGATKSTAWPKSARGLRAVINRVGPALRATGIQVEHKRTNQKRIIKLFNLPKEPSHRHHRTQAQSKTSAFNGLNGDGRPNSHGHDRHAGIKEPSHSHRPSRNGHEKPVTNQSSDANNRGDGRSAVLHKYQDEGLACPLCDGEGCHHCRGAGIDPED